MEIKPFGVELWMNEFELKCEFNLAETCVESITIAQLLELAGCDETALSELLPLKMTYGAIEGSDRLRDAIAAFYERQARENILVTHGTIGANALVHQALISRGDKVVSIVPSYQQHYSIPNSIGADVQMLHLRAENKFLPDFDELRSLVTPDTRMIAVTNPNNPTGALIEGDNLAELVSIARDADAWLLSDEVYRGTDQEGSGITTSVADIYEKGISTASLSKAFSLAGLRVGWIAAPQEVLSAVTIHRDYNTISVSMVDDFFAALAMESTEKILARSHKITRGNLRALAEWVEQEPKISWVRPQSGTTALLNYSFDMPSREFCTSLLHETGVLFTPGSTFDMEGCVRIGYANGPAVLTAGLARVSAFLADK